MSQLHKPVFGMMIIVAAFEFVRSAPLRKPLLITGVTGGVLTLLWPLTGFQVGVNDRAIIEWFPGFHLHDRLSLGGLLVFWIMNWGLHVLLLPVGYYFASPQVRALLAPACILFLIAHLVRFNPDVLTNHKFLNFTQIILCVFSAVALWRAYDELNRLPNRALRVLGLAAIFAAVIVLTASGVIDHAAQANERKFALRDVGNDGVATWIAERTPKNAVFLNSRFLYHPASIAGRKIFVGWPYFVLGAGYDYEIRRALLEKMYSTVEPAALCDLLDANGIDYMTLEDTSGIDEMPPIPVENFARHYRFAYDDGQVRILERGEVCRLPRTTATPSSTN